MVALPDHGPERDLWCDAAVSEWFRGGELLGRWLVDHPQANEAERRTARRTVLAVQQAAKIAVDVDGANALRLPVALRAKVLEQIGAVKAIWHLERRSKAALTSADNLLLTLLARESVQLNLQDRNQLVALATLAPLAKAAGAPPAFDVETLPARIKELDLQEAIGGPDLHRFVGREKELKALRRLWRGKRDVLVGIVGPGGIGKSLLVSRFVSDLLEEEDIKPAAVFHIDFDRRDLQGARELSILAEFGRQAHLWVAPKDAHELAEMAQSAKLSNFDSNSKGRSSDHEAARELSQTLSAALKRAARKSGAPRIVVFADSAERVIGFDDTAVRAPWTAGRALRKRGIGVFMIYGSRALPPDCLPEKPNTVLPLTQLSVAAASSYLTAELARAGLPAAANTVSSVLKAVGRSPLALRLASSILAKEGGQYQPKDWPNLLTTSSERIQAALYDRVLKRINDPNVRRIAFPGLLVRRLTVAVIEHVLAGPCGLNLNLTPANNLLYLARRELQLFTHDKSDPDPEAIWHRPDVRAMMLADLSAKVPDEVALQINRNAVDYYATQTDNVSRVEELYHRLRLGESAETIEMRWTADAGARLQSAIGELPPHARRFVRRKLGAASVSDAAVEAKGLVGAPDDVSLDAAYADLRGVAARMVQDGEDPLPLLIRQNLDRLDGPAGDILADVFLRQGRIAELLDGARQLRSTGAGSATARCGVFATAASALEGLGRLSESHVFWASARSVSAASSFSGRLAELGAQIGLMRVARKVANQAGYVPDAPEVLRAVALVKALESDIYNRRVTIREVVAELTDPRIWDLSNDREMLQDLAQMALRGRDAFPSALSDPVRAREISRELGVGIDHESPFELSSYAAKLVYGGPEDIARLGRVLRAEVDWTLVKAVGAAAHVSRS